MNGGLLINQIGELLVRRLAEAVQACAEDGRMRRDVKDEDARVADLYRLGEKLACDPEPAGAEFRTNSTLCGIVASYT